MKSFRDEIARHSSQAGAQRAPIMLSAPLLKLLLLATIDCASAAIFPPRSAGLLRLRGGDDDDDDVIMQRLRSQGNVGPLSHEEIVEKLNKVPTFCIMQADGSVISLPDPDAEGEECCTWFIDAEEAKYTLKRVKAANPDLEGLRLQGHGLGDFLTVANGWPIKTDAPLPTTEHRLKLQGPKEVKRLIGPQLLSALASAGLQAGIWQLGVFVAEDLAAASPEGAQILLPIFLSPDDVRAAYEQAGLPPKALENIKVMELRQLLQVMAQGTPDAVNPWRAVQMITSAGNVKLAEELTA